MIPRLWGQNCNFFTTPLSRNYQKRLERKENQTKCRKMNKKPGSHVRILIYWTWAMGVIINSLSNWTTVLKRVNVFFILSALHDPGASSTGITFLIQRWRRELMALRLVTTLSTSTSAVSVELVLLVSTPSLSLSVSSTSPSKIFLNVFSVWSSKKDDQFCLTLLGSFSLLYSTSFLPPTRQRSSSRIATLLAYKEINVFAEERENA